MTNRLTDFKFVVYWFYLLGKRGGGEATAERKIQPTRTSRGHRLRAHIIAELCLDVLGRLYFGRRVDKTWKAVERRVAKLFHTRRTPLSGRSSQHGTSSDSLHPELYLEVKHRQKHSAVELFRDTKAKATKEGKRPVVILAQKNLPNLYAVVPLDPGYLLKLASDLEATCD